MLVYPGKVKIFGKLKDRVIVNFTDNHMSLTIMSLLLNDSGRYTLQNGDNVYSVELSVQGEVTPMSFHSCS